MHFLSTLVGTSLETTLLEVGGILCATLALGLFLRFLIRRFLVRLVGRTRMVLDDKLCEILSRHIPWLLLLLVAYQLVLVLGIEPPFTEPPLLRVMKGTRAVLYILNALYIALIVTRIVDALISWYLHDIAKKTATQLDDELAPLVNRLTNILLLLLTVIVILEHFDLNVSTLVVSLGVGSLALALAAQDTLANMIAGFTLMIDRPFRVGDRVRLSDGLYGNVFQIGLRSTKVIDDANIMTITPNAEIVKSQIRNLSYPNEVVRFSVFFAVAYGVEIADIRRLVLKAVHRAPDIVDQENSEVRCIEFGESSLRMELMVRVRNPNSIPRRRADLLEVIYSTLRAHSIEIPFPQRVIRFHSDADPRLPHRE